MRTFALVWTVIFLLAVIPVMRLDHRIRIRKEWAKIGLSTRRLSDQFFELGMAAKKAEVSLRGLQSAILELKEKD